MYDVVTIGSATRDVFLRSRGAKTIHTEHFATGAGTCIPFGSKIAVDELVFSVGGSAANAAVTFARRGRKTAAISKIGRDAQGDEIVEELKKEKVDTKFIVRDPKELTAYSVVLIMPSGERSILTYRGAESMLSPADVSVSKLRANWFYMTHLGGNAAALFPKILRHAERIGAHVAVNPGKTQLTMPLAKFRPLLNLIDVFVLNREEAAQVTKLPYKNIDGIFKKLDLWVRGLVVMTDGPKGVIVSDGKTRWRAGVLKEKRVLDRTGAGDAFGSGFVSGLIEKKDNIPYAIQLGSANATSNIEILGAQTGLLRKGQSITKWGKLKITESRI